MDTYNFQTDLKIKKILFVKPIMFLTHLFNNTPWIYRRNKNPHISKLSRGWTNRWMDGHDESVRVSCGSRYSTTKDNTHIPPVIKFELNKSNIQCQNLT